MTDFKALYADLKALYAKHFKPAPKQKTFGNIIDGLLESIESVEKAEANVSTLRPQLITLAASIKDGAIMKKIEDFAADAQKPVEEKPIIDKRCYDGNEDYDNMFG